VTETGELNRFRSRSFRNSIWLAQEQGESGTWALNRLRSKGVRISIWLAQEQGQSGTGAFNRFRSRGFQEQHLVGSGARSIRNRGI
jgi:hypothetical protein